MTEKVKKGMKNSQLNELNRDIFLAGVGGQGIGMLSEVLIRAADYAGYPVLGVDTHGLAQRGGMVVSHLRLGSKAFSPLIRKQQADMVIALERNEAFRAMIDYLKKGGQLIYYDTSWQTLATRLGQEKDITGEKIEAKAKELEVKQEAVYKENLADARMQNMVLLGHIAKKERIPEIAVEDYRQAIKDLMTGSMLENNLELFNSLLENES